MGVIAGPMVDAGWLRTLVFTSSFMVVFGMMMTSLVTEYYQVSNFFFFNPLQTFCSTNNSLRRLFLPKDSA